RGSCHSRSQPAVRLRVRELGPPGSGRAGRTSRWMEHAAMKGAMRVLVIDIGGTNLKISCTGQRDITKVPSGPEMSASAMAAAVKRVAADWKYDVVSIGYP